MIADEALFIKCAKIGTHILPVNTNKYPSRDTPYDPAMYFSVQA